MARSALPSPLPLCRFTPSMLNCMSEPGMPGVTDPVADPIVVSAVAHLHPCPKARR